MYMWKPVIWVVCLLLLSGSGVLAQNAQNDTIRLGASIEHGQVFPMILLPEVATYGAIIDAAEKARKNRLRSDIYEVYPYALAAAAVFKEINNNLDNLSERRERKRYLKTMDKQLDHTFKEPLKNLSIDQGHVLIKLVNRQTGQNCYSIIKELKGGFSAVLWQSVGVFFNNNLNRDYDPEGDDKEIEAIVRELEASNAYRYQMYQQQALLQKVKKP